MVVVLIIPISLCQAPIICPFYNPSEQEDKELTPICVASLLPSFSTHCTDKREEQHERRGGYDVENYQFFPVHLLFTHPTVSQN